MQVPDLYVNNTHAVVDRADSENGPRSYVLMVHMRVGCMVRRIGS